MTLCVTVTQQLQVELESLSEILMSNSGAAIDDAEMFGSDDDVVPATTNVPAQADSDEDMGGLFGDEDNDVPKDDASYVKQTGFSQCSVNLMALP